MSLHLSKFSCIPPWVESKVLMMAHKGSYSFASPNFHAVSLLLLILLWPLYPGQGTRILPSQNLMHLLLPLTKMFLPQKTKESFFHLLQYGCILPPEACCCDINAGVPLNCFCWNVLRAWWACGAWWAWGAWWTWGVWWAWNWVFSQPKCLQHQR